jgi:uncharacterized protein (TIGR02145 family)
LKYKNHIGFISLALLLLLFCCAKEKRDNPFDGNGANWHPPVVKAMADASVNINDSITITATATDNGAVMKYFWALNGITYTDSTTAGSLRTAFGSAGAKKVIVKVVDDDGIFPQPDTCLIIVTPSPPILTPKKDTAVSKTMSVTENVIAVDTNSTGKIVKYYWDIGANGWDDSTDAGTYTFTKPEGGPMAVIWDARDDDKLISADTFRILFSRPPTSAAMIEPVNGDTADWVDYDPSTYKGTILLRYSGTDPDGSADTLTYILKIGKSLASLSEVYKGKNTSYTATGIETATNYYWQITATDLFGESVVSNGTFVSIAFPIDIDGILYHYVKLGKQLWTIENLRTTRFNDGTTIPKVTDMIAWNALLTPGYFYFNNTANLDTIKKCGAFYNWYAVNTKKLAPKGWHVTTDADWSTLETYLIANGYNYDGTTTLNKVAKSMATKTDWKASGNTGAIGNDLSKNNRSGFSAFPAGYRQKNSLFLAIGQYSIWWKDSEFNTSNVYSSELDYREPSLRSFYYDKGCGLSVRLVRD